MRFNNFSIWRGKLPHWRADDVTYFVTFRHSRPLDETERFRLFQSLVRPDGRSWDLEALLVLPERTELMFKVRLDKEGRPLELSDIVEKAKTKTGKWIIKKTGERWPPFYQESYDRIVRDAAEFEERWLAILGAPVDEALVEDAEEYECLYLRHPEE